MPPGMPPGGGGLPPGLAGMPGMPPGAMAGAMAGGLLGLAGHPGMPPTSAAAVMAAAGSPGGLHSLMRPDLRDDKSALSALEDRLKHSASSHSQNNRGRSPSVHGDERRPASNPGHHRSSTPNEESSKRIKLEENPRKPQQVGFFILI